MKLTAKAPVMQAKRLVSANHQSLGKNVFDQQVGEWFQ